LHYRELSTPAVIIDLDVVERNLDRMAEWCQRHGIGLRPHTKTHKTIEVARMQMERGAVGLTVAKVGEAEVMAQAGPYEILVAHPILGQEKLQRLAAVARRQLVIVAVDSEFVARELAQAAAAQDVTFGVLLEFDSGFHRCGVQIGPGLVSLANTILSLPGLRFRGLMTYFGNVWGTGHERRNASAKVTAAVERARELFVKAGIPLEIVSGGSTPASWMPETFPGLTETRPGSYVYNDLNTYHQGLCEISDCAVRVITSVVSTAVPQQAMVDAGSKTFSSDLLTAGPMAGFGYVVEHPEVQLSNLDEEHGYLRNVQAAGLSVGEVLTVIPNHVCTCINMHDEAWLVRKEEVVGSWRFAARGKVR
jgi:D-serine deaminase-like pyridoxal phosphate-dependent protein